MEYNFVLINFIIEQIIYIYLNYIIYIYIRYITVIIKISVKNKADIYNGIQTRKCGLRCEIYMSSVLVSLNRRQIIRILGLSQGLSQQLI